MALRLNGSSSGYVELDVPAAAGSHTLTLPDGGGTSGQYLQTNGSGGLSWQTVTDTANITQVTYQSLSGTSVTFTSLPADIKRLVISVWGLSFNGDSDLGIRIGDSGGLETSGYFSSTSYHQNSGYGARAATDQFRVISNGSSDNYYGFFEMIKVRSDSNQWVFKGVTTKDADGSLQMSAGYKSLSGTLDRVELKPYDTSKSFDAGNASIMYQI